MEQKKRFSFEVCTLFKFLLKNYLEVLLCSLIIPMVLLIFGQIIFRYVLKSPPSWTEEAARFIFTWVCFMAAAYVFKNKGNMAMTIIFKYIPSHVLFFYKQLINLLILFALIIYVYYGIKSCIIIYGILSPALEINMVYINAALPVGGAIMLCYQLLFIIKNY